MDYFAAYMARVNTLGSSPKERELNASIKDFNKYLNEHPSVEKVTIGKQSFLISILSNKQDNNKLTKQILSALSTPVVPGTILRWKNADWIVFRQEQNPNEAYHSSYMVKCNSALKWVNKFGVLCSSPCYVKGSMESIIKENFRSWDNIIVPQANQTLGCVVPTQDITISQKFIIDERAWAVIDYDKTSVDGIMYLSLTEDKIDNIDDDVAQEITDIYKLNNYKIVMPYSKVEINAGATYVVTPLVYKDGILVTENIKCIIPRNTIGATYTVIENVFTLRATSSGSVAIKFCLVSDERVYTTLTLECKTTPVNATTYMIIGNSAIKVGREEMYSVIKTSPNDVEKAITAFTISDESLATGNIINGKLVIIANTKNKIGNIVLTIYSDNQVLTKTVNIVPLW